jgi:hypothetical protein
MRKKILSNPALRLPIYPLIIPLYWPLLLIKANIFQIALQDGLRVLTLTFMAATIFFFFAHLALKDWHQAAILTTLSAVLFNSFILMMDGWKILLWIIVATLTIFLTMQPGNRLSVAAPWANTMALGTILVLSINILYVSTPRDLAAPGPTPQPIQLNPMAGRPNIYLIVLDSYTRADLLLSRYKYDNSAFLDGLRSRGFNVDDCAMSNYTKTELTLSSMFNLDYIDDLDRYMLWNDIRHSVVRSSLEKIGYKTVAFPTGFVWADIPDVDYYIIPPDEIPLADFEFFWLRQTPLVYAGNLLPMDFSQLYGYSYYQRTMNALKRFPTLSNLTDEPIFAYVHVIAPHPPFVFDQQGTFFDYTSLLRDEQNFLAGGFTSGYTMELNYLNERVSKQLDVLIQNDPDAVIIIMADHGPWFTEGLDAYKILFTYRFPDQENVLSPCTSPVNLFRWIFSSYFGADLPGLDTWHFSPEGVLYKPEQ